MRQATAQGTQPTCYKQLATNKSAYMFKLFYIIKCGCLQQTSFSTPISCLIFSFVLYHMP